MTLKMYDLAGADEALRFSPYCWRVRYCCAHKGLPLETVPWRFTDKALLPAPNEGTVPVLIDAGQVVTDSWRIALHLDARHPGPALFDGDQSRALALMIKFWIERTVHPLITRMAVRDAWLGLHAKDQPYFRTSREQRLGRPLEEVVRNREETRGQFGAALEPLRALLGEQRFVCGAAPAFADYAVFGAFMWVRCVSNFEVLADGDPVQAWRERMLDLYGGLGRGAVRNAQAA